MFFIFSKLLKFAITPLMWVLLLLFFALISRDQFKRKKYLIWSFILLMFFSNSFIFNFFMGAWEIPTSKHPYSGQYEAAIILGGVSHYNEEEDRIQFIRGADRLFQAIELYKIGKVKKLVFTGGSGYVLHPEYKEGALVKKYVMKLGIPEGDFIVENESRNTRENAVFTKKILEQEKISGELLLITSGFHMRRSLACFNKVGLFPVPYSADIYGKPIIKNTTIEWDTLIVPNLDAFQSWTNFIHELVGYLVYKLSGFA